MLSGAQGIPRRLYRRSRARLTAREESRFRTRLRHDPNAPELLLSPHFDDAVLDCWSLLAGERELQVMNLFAAAPAPGRLTPWDETTGASDSAERVRERVAEDARALALASREPHNLSFLDAQYRRGAPPSLEDLDREVGARLAGAARVYVPAGIGSHVDHLLARRYGRMLARAGMPVTLYAELPYCILHGWPGWVDGREPDPHRNVDAFWRSFLGDVPEVPDVREGTVIRLDSDAASCKLAAMRCYETQYACLDYGARGMLSDPEVHRFEVLWDLRHPGGRGHDPAPSSGATRPAAPA